MKNALIIFFALVLVTAPAMAFAQGNPPAAPAATPTLNCSSLTTTGLSGISGCIISVLNQIVVLLMAGAVVVIVWGAFTFMSSEEKREAGRQKMVYGIIGLFVMVSIWGLVNILTNTFKLRGTYETPPQLTPPTP